MLIQYLYPAFMGETGRKTIITLELYTDDYCMLDVLKNYLYKSKLVLFAGFRYDHLLDKKVIFKIETTSEQSILKTIMNSIKKISLDFYMFFILISQIIRI
ncbi:hypothetical protein M951_chr252 (nucleomorph) [Lotharella oceanica]|uniref:DNA-directed RNA polymerase II complex subunit Rpb11 n=1 Tax=Lotharella oceanica TaxID=641309 RepID=A0A060DGK6_9EUKA|nr:DNA-directed RNA polymerase II complex subunit Rpb11 [Lotharella oceanica]AIB09755.1 hypothetical protein M951_chr252 [Lotharella oceanica]